MFPFLSIWRDKTRPLSTTFLPDRFTVLRLNVMLSMVIEVWLATGIGGLLISRYWNKHFKVTFCLRIFTVISVMAVPCVRFSESFTFFHWANRRRLIGSISRLSVLSDRTAVLVIHFRKRRYLPQILYCSANLYRFHRCRLSGFCCFPELPTWGNTGLCDKLPRGYLLHRIGLK